MMLRFQLLTLFQQNSLFTLYIILEIPYFYSVTSWLETNSEKIYKLMTLPLFMSIICLKKKRNTHPTNRAKHYGKYYSLKTGISD